MKRLMLLYKKLSLPAKASLWYMICSVMQKGISIITTPIFTRILSTDQYGLITIYNSWEAIITVFATLNFTAGVYNNAMVRYPEDRDGYTSVLQTWTSFITIALFAVYLLTSSFWNGIFGLTTPMMVMMFVDIIFTAGMSFWSIRNRYEYKYRWVCVITMLTSILVPIVSVIFVHLTDVYKSEAKIFGTVVVHVIIYGVIYVLNIKKGKKIVEKEYITYSTKFNIPLIPHYLAQNVLSQADRVMIKDMCSVAKAGIYGVAYQAGYMISIVISSINSSFVPYLYESLKVKRYKQIGDLALKIEILIGCICFLFSLFAPEFLLILAPSEYFEAIWIIPPVAMSSLFIMMYSFFTNVEFFFEKNKFIMVASTGAALLNVILNYIFIKLFGYLAAGYTTLVCYVFYSFSQYLFMLHICKQKEVPSPYNGKIMWSVAVVFVVLSLISEFLYKNNIIRYSVIAIMTLIGGMTIIKKKDDISAMFKH